MNTLRTTLLAAAAGLLLTGAAHATDFYAGPSPTPATMADADSIWDGIYVGVYGTGEFFEPGNPDSYFFGIGKFVGVNFRAGDNFVLGVEGRAGVYFDGGPDYGEAFGYARAGYLLHEDVLLYKLVGIGREFSIGGGGGSPGLWAFGAGIEWAASETMSVRADVQRRGCITGVCIGGPWVVVQGGVAWHF